MEKLPPIVSFLYVLFVFVHVSMDPFAAASDGTWYDSSASAECKRNPEAPLYNGGLLVDVGRKVQRGFNDKTRGVYAPAYVLENVTKDTLYTFACWIRIKGADSALIKARFSADNTTFICIGSVLATNGCWSFLKGGFVLDSSHPISLLFFQSSNDRLIEIFVTSASLESFTAQQWRNHQDQRIQKKRKRAITIHVSDSKGNRVPNATVMMKQISKDFPFGSAISSSILGNLAYQVWFAERFNAAVFENELKWYVTEPQPGKINYSLADQLLGFTRANQIAVRGHNIFWENPIVTPSWVRNLTGDDLMAAINRRIESLMSKYSSEFMHWDVNNEMLHFDFYEERLGSNASFYFFQTTQKLDPLASLFMNEFNVIETCDDDSSTVDNYVLKLKELKRESAIMEGIGLQGHFVKPNLPLMRATLDKLATLGLPIWLTEIDISKTIDPARQAVYLEEVLREGFSHPSVNGMMLWTALNPNGCYQMCLTDNNLRNLPTGDVVDKLLQEWQTAVLKGRTDEYGSYSFNGFLGEYMVSVSYENKTANSTFSLSPGDETRHFNIHL